MKKLLLLFMFIASTCYSAPSNSVSTPNSFSAGATIKSADFNTNFNHIQNIYNAHTHTDITQLGTVSNGVWGGTKISVQFGGTGQDFTNAVQGSIPYFYTTGSFTNILAGTEGQVFLTHGSGSNPSWGSVNLASTTFSGTLGVTKGGTGVTTNTWSLGAISDYAWTLSSSTSVTNTLFKICYGSFSSVGANGTVSITNLPFSNSISYTVIVTRGDSTDTSQSWIAPAFNRVTGARFDLTNAADSPSGYGWVAVGQ